MKNLTYQTLVLEQPGEHVLTVRINRPEVRNAISTQVGADLHDVFTRLINDSGDYRCVILTGTGDKAFCAGGDLKERNGMADAQWMKQHALFERMTLSLLDCPIPLIGAVNGAAFGGGCELILTCDFAYASTAARFGLPEITLGIMPGAGGTQFLPRVAGSRRAKEIVLTGAGDKAFCAGGDLKERHGMTDEQWMAQHAIFERMTLALMDCPIPVIAAVNGAAFGGGCELTLTCDFAYASTSARFALTEITLGIMPGAGGTQFLPRAVGSRRAKEIILTGKPFSAQDALDWGVVNKLCAPEKLMEETLATAQTICDNAPISVRQAKRSMHFGMQMDIRSALFFEIDAYNKMVSTEDRHEGVRAFNEKRKPKFKGR